MTCDRFYGETDWHANGLPTPDELRASNKRRAQEIASVPQRTVSLVDGLFLVPLRFTGGFGTFVSEVDDDGNLTLPPRTAS